MVGSSRFLFDLSSAFEGELSVSDLSPSSSGGSYVSASSESTVACGSTATSSAGEYVSCTEQIGVVGYPNAVDNSKTDHFPSVELPHIE